MDRSSRPNASGGLAMKYPRQKKAERMAGVFLAATIFGGTALLCLKPVMFLVFAAGLGLGVMGMFYIWLSSELERLKL